MSTQPKMLLKQNSPRVEFIKSKLQERMMSWRKYILVSVDVLSLAIAIIIGWVLAEMFKSYLFPDVQALPWSKARDQIPVLFGLPAIYIIFASGFRGHYVRFKPYWDELSESLRIILTAAVIVIAFLYFTKSHLSRMWFISAWILVILILPSGRLLAKRAMMSFGIWFTPTVIIGNGPVAVASAEAVESDPLLGMNVIAQLSPDPKYCDPALPYESVYIGEQPEITLREMGDPYVVLALESSDYNRHANLIDRLCGTQLNMSIVPPLPRVPLIGSEVSHVFRHEILLLRVRNNLARRSPLLLKRCFDLVLAVFLLLILSPLFAILTWRISRDGGKIFYKQRRVGRHGRFFYCYKFRTMVPDAETVLERTLDGDEVARKEWEKDFKLKNDPRITLAGKFLRQTSLDELPQLWNVILGEMSLVGPRPIVEEELARYGDQVNLYLEASPGMTGLWQISGRNDTEYQSRVNLDAWYARNWSLWYDIVILTKTIPLLFNRKGAY